MNRIDRLLAILLLLQRDRRTRAVDLAVRFAVSERTIYRDMRALTEMGVPLATLPGEGYELLDTFRLPPLMLSLEEATALFLAGRMLVRTGKGQIALHTETALSKVAAVLPQETKDRLHRMARMIDFFPTQDGLNWDEPHLMAIIAAIDTRRTLPPTPSARASSGRLPSCRWTCSVSFRIISGVRFALRRIHRISSSARMGHLRRFRPVRSPLSRSSPRCKRKAKPDHVE
jgi:DNA-binding Lrp family transcriptional regulator